MVRIQPHPHHTWGLLGDHGAPVAETWRQRAPTTNDALHSQLGMEATYHKAPSGLGHQALWRSRAANNRFSVPADIGWRNARPGVTKVWSPDTSAHDPWHRYHGSVACCTKGRAEGPRTDVMASQQCNNHRGLTSAISSRCEPLRVGTTGLPAQEHPSRGSAPWHGHEGDEATRSRRHGGTTAQHSRPKCMSPIPSART